jgi:hypothetical protein
MAGGVCSRDAVERRMGALNALAGALLLPLSFGMVIGALRIASRRISGGRERSNSAEIDGLFVGFLVQAPPNVGVPGSRRLPRAAVSSINPIDWREMRAGSRP